MTKLSREYESTIEYPVEYINLPKDRLLQKEPLKKVSIHLKTTGFKIFSGTLFPRTIKIDASTLFLKSNTNYFLLLSQQKLAIQRQMNAEVTIDHFINDSIYFNLGYLKQKKVPIKLKTKLSYEKGFDISGNLKINPDSVTVLGPESVIDSIQFVETTDFTRENINESIQEDLPLRKYPKESNITLEVETIKISASVEKFTEGTLKVPFSIINLPENVSINTYPKEIDVTYKVALSNFNKVNLSSFVIECDYKMSSGNGLRYLLPKLVKQSNFVKNVTIFPDKIDFIIEK